MKNWIQITCIACLSLSTQKLISQTQPPFTIQLEEVTWADWPALHSFAYGTWNNRWFVMSGRTGGLHGFLPPTPFAIAQANFNIWMLDPQTGEQWNKNIYTLPADIANQLQATNTQYFQRDKYLYIIGGYGRDTVSENFITFPSLLAIDMQLLNDSMEVDGDISAAFRKLDDSLFQVTGGDAEIFNDKIYLFGGHVFTGLYTKPASPLFTQQYTNELRKFNLNDDGSTLSVSDVEKIKDTVNFHRRDLNVEQIILPGGQKGLAAFSGVFQYDGDIPWPNDIYFTADDYYADTTFVQQFNNYTCPVMNIFDSVSNNFYATFFGGISRFYFDVDDSIVKEDLNIPFVKDISTLIKYADGTVEQKLLPQRFDAYLGSNAIFVLNDSLSHYDNGVIKLQAVNGEVFAGYIYGGIKADVPNFTPSTASNRLFKVYINYEPIPPAYVQDELLSVTIAPNPAHDVITIKNNSAQKIKKIQIVNVLGVAVYNKNVVLNYNEHYTLDIKYFQKGIYYIVLFSESYISTSKIIFN